VNSKDRMGNLARIKEILINESIVKRAVKIFIFSLLLILAFSSRFFVHDYVAVTRVIARIVEAVMIFLLGKEIIYITSAILFGMIKSEKTVLITDQILTLLWGLVIIISAFVFLSIQSTLSSIIIGLIGFGLTFTLQQPLLSFIGWIYILIKRPFTVGDRIKVGNNIKGDVIEFDYFSTKLLEFGGDYTSTETPSGRIIMLPNSMVIQQPVFNYSATGSYIWDEIVFKVSYESDLIERKVKSLLEKHLKYDDFKKPVRKMQKIVARSFIDKVDISPEPEIIMAPNSLGWIDVKVDYLTHIKRMSGTKTEITRLILEELAKYPNKVKYPEGRRR
jgi:small-conductance mechanosensitive channel